MQNGAHENGNGEGNGSLSKPDHDPVTGKFLPGNKARTKSATSLRTCREVFRNAVSNQDVVDLAQRLVKAGRDGDVQAIRLILAYKIGQPQRMEDIDDIPTDGETGPRMEYL